MKFVLLMAIALAAVSVTLVATADEAAACKPPNCPGFGTCYIKDEEFAQVDIGDGHAYGVSKPTIECYY